jgi:hypothetical protein
MYKDRQNKTTNTDSPSPSQDNCVSRMRHGSDANAALRSGTSAVSLRDTRMSDFESFEFRVPQHAQAKAIA